METISQFGCEQLFQLYSPDLTPTNLYLFSSVKEFLRDDERKSTKQMAKNLVHRFLGRKNIKAFFTGKFVLKKRDYVTK